jgi:hypothetical protein
MQVLINNTKEAVAISTWPLKACTIGTGSEGPVNNAHRRRCLRVFDLDPRFRWARAIGRIEPAHSGEHLRALGVFDVLDAALSTFQDFLVFLRCRT